MKRDEQRQLDGQTKTQRIVGCVCLSVFAFVAFLFLLLLCLDKNAGFLYKNRAWIILLAAILLSLLTGFGVGCGVKDKISLFRSVIILSFLLAFLLIGYFVLQKIGFIDIIRDPEKYKEFLQNAGGWMAAIYILLQFLQVVVLPIPSIVSTLAGVALFGPHLAALYSFVGIVAGSLLAFFIGRKLGYKAVSWIVGKEDLNKWRTKLKGKDNFIITAMFLLPLFPDDILCFVSGLSSMSNRYFIVMMCVCRLIGVAATCYSVQLFPLNTWWGLLCWGVLYVLVAIAFVFFYKNTDKVDAWLKKMRKRKKG